MKNFLSTLFLLSLLGTSGCNPPTSVQESAVPTAPQSAARNLKFAGGAKLVKIITSNLNSGSFPNPSPVPGITPVPSPYPGNSSTSTYLPGISATQFFDASGTVPNAKPAWLYDFQLGITSNTPSGSCAAFGGSANADVSNFYRISEVNCAAAPTPVPVGTGGNLDPVFLRIVLNRNADVLGTAENLLLQIEYQASSLRLNSDGISTTPDDNLDQLWKVFWNTSLSSGAVPNIFSIFVPPNYAACLAGGSEIGGTPSTGTAAPGACVTGYRGSPITVKQMIIPLSAYPSMSVIQISRLKGRINHTTDTFPVSGGPVNYVNSFLSLSPDCTTDSPLCLGLVIRSILLMRI